MRRLALSGLLLAAISLPALAAPSVVASIVPVHSLAAAIMQGVGTPELLLSGQNSEHTASLTPRQLEQLIKADAVFMVGEGLESKLVQLDGSEAVGGRRFVALADTPGLATLPIREGGSWEPHHHDDEEAEHHDAPSAAETDHDHAVHAAFDPHIWLSPTNARVMAGAIAAELSRLDPANAAAYAANAARLDHRLDETSARLTAELAPVKDRPFIVFHDAYQYFERAFGLSGVGSITDIAGAPPSAQRLKDIQDRIRSTQAACVFREPQFPADRVVAITADTGTRTGVLDPLGAGLTPGPEAYPTLLDDLAASLKTCLSG